MQQRKVIGKQITLLIQEFNPIPLQLRPEHSPPSDDGSIRWFASVGDGIFAK
jgi:hypothetical protein